MNHSLHLKCIDKTWFNGDHDLTYIFKPARLDFLDFTEKYSEIYIYICLEDKKCIDDARTNSIRTILIAYFLLLMRFVNINFSINR